MSRKTLLALSCAFFSSLLKAPPTLNPQRFENLFHQALGRRGFNAALYPYLLSPLPEELWVDRIPAPTQSSLAEIDALFRRYSPMELARRTWQAPTENLPEIRALLKRHPITFLMSPGIFGEFIKDAAFSEVLNRRNSIFAQQWERAARAIEVESNGRMISLADAISAASIDDEGAPLVRYMIFNTPEMSFESLGQIESIAAVFLGRFVKALPLIGPTPNLVLGGYSRGVMVLMEMLARANERKAEWLEKVRGVVSLGGVVWGSGLADQMLDPTSDLAKQLEALEVLKDGLLACSRTGSVIHNTVAWARFLAAQKTDTALLQKVLSGEVKVDFQNSWTVLAHYWRAFGLESPRENYVANVQLFKAFATELLFGVRQLTTAARVSWAAQNTLPTNMRYYGLGATMEDPRDGGLALANPVSYAPHSVDCAMLVTNHQQFIDATGDRLNDSQVALQRTFFWPKLTQGNIQATNLGVLRSHHWGIALPKVNDIDVNPYPREALFEAIAAGIALDLE